MSNKNNTTTPVVKEEDEYTKRVTNPYNASAAEYKTAFDERVSDIDTNIDAQKKAAEDQAKQNLDNADKQYRRQYDANAIQEVLDRNTLNERMANMGLTNSGLNATQQTAIALARGNRDASTTANHSQFINDTELALQKMYNDAEEERASQKMLARQEYADSLNDSLQGYEKLYSDYLNEQAKAANEAQKNQNELTLSIAKQLISEGKINEAVAYLDEANKNGGEDSTVGTRDVSGYNKDIDITKIPYKDRPYKILDTSNGWLDFWGEGEQIVDMLTGDIISDDEFERRVGTSYSDYIMSGWTNGNNLEDFIDNADKDTVFVPSQVVLGKGALSDDAAVQNYLLEIYDGNAADQINALMNLAGMSKADATTLVQNYYFGEVETTEE